MIYEFNHVGVFVSDLDATLSFYRDRLGAVVVSEAFIPASGTDCVYVQLATGLIEFLHPRAPATGTVFGLNHIAFLTDDLDGDFTRLTAAGAPALVSPKVAGSGRGRLAFVGDPNGVRVELLQRPEEFRIAPVVDGPIRSLSHVSIAGEDLGAAVQFYSEQVSMERRNVAAETPTASYGIGPDTLRLCSGVGADSPRIRHLGLEPVDIAGVCATLREAGIAVESGNSGELADVVYAHDPDGVRLVLGASG